MHLGNVGSISYHPRHPLTPPEKIFRPPKTDLKHLQNGGILGFLVSTHVFFVGFWPGG